MLIVRGQPALPARWTPRAAPAPKVNAPALDVKVYASTAGGAGEGSEDASELREKISGETVKH
ncbi:MAG: hypothetical protein CYPHOPRED_005068 [Cyphobasidiales sp. Tagirdzhanova-0007]|nr:MAG: hypothetical protein CYPHOPRED_005068 [Cyphobasidiales sp. Tagirdzhanova-0007]